MVGASPDVIAMVVKLAVKSHLKLQLACTEIETLMASTLLALQIRILSKIVIYVW